jgi:GDSL-like Lipase/Acylhydrolase family
MSSRRRNQRLTVAGFALAGVLAVGAVGAIAAAALDPQAPPPVSDKVASYYSNPPTKAAAREPGKLAPAVALLGDTKRPWTLQVVGDSTGASSVRWVYVLAARMSVKYDRPVVIHDWNVTSNSYATETTVGDGNGASIVIWNGSATGKGTQYSMDNWAAMTAQRPDLLVVNHGLNMPDADAARAGVKAVVDRAITQWPEAPALAVTIQSPRTDKSAATEEQTTDVLRRAWTGSLVTVIDVNQAFKAAGDPAPLLISDGLHPSVKGAQIWADAVQKELGL